MVHTTSKFFAVALLWVHLLILEVNTADDLEFWEADPKFDTRRHEKNKKEESEEVTSTTHKSTRYRRRRTTSTTSEEQSITPRFRATSEAETVDSRQEVRASQTRRSGNRVTLKTKRIRDKYQGRQGEDDNVMSTRFVTDAEPKQDSKKWWWFTDSKNKTGRYSLSPYSIAKQLTDITSKMPEANVTIETLGRTAEYNDIVLLKVAEKKSDIEKYFRADDSKYIDEIPEKKIIFIVHALSVMGIDRMSVFKYNNYFSKLLSYYFAHLDKYDIFLIPMANPDGYAYCMNRAGNVIWNKNLSPQDGCAGVALDRNFDVAWNVSKSISTCSQQYPGAKPFSEPETRAVRDVMHRYSHKIAAYIHLHSGSYDHDSFKGDAILYPKGYTDVQTDDDKYIDLKGEIDESIKNASFRYVSVAVDTLHNWYGKVFGTSVDYASTVYGIPYALEMVMQIYDSPTADSNSEENVENMALEQIWGRVIDVVFNSIWKNMHSNDLQ